MLLAIEVADSSLRVDLHEKAELYAQARNAEYWIIDANDRCVHVFRDPMPREYADRTIATVGGSLSPLHAPDVWLDIHELFLGE